MILAPDQQDAVSWLYEHDETLLVAPMGAGKTIVALTAIQELLAAGELTRVLVVAPLEVADATWREEVAKWAWLKGLRVGFALGSQGDRLEALSDPDFHVVVINFDNLAWLKPYLDGFDGLVIDEGTKMTATGARRFRAFRKYIKSFRWRVVMSGTPVAQGLDKLFGQMLIVDGGETLGGSKQRFLDTWFRPLDFERRRWEPNPELVDRLLARVAPWVYQMPEYPRCELRQRIEWVELPDDARAVYRALTRDHVLEEPMVTCANEAVLKGKQLQVASGFVYDDEGESHQLHDEKWQRMLETVEFHYGASTPWLIVYHYDFHKDWLQKAGIPLFSKKLLPAWNRGEVRLMAIHPKSCGHGLNLQKGGSRLVWLGPGWSRDQHDQVLARLWRRGQPAEYVESVMICARGTADEDALARLDWHEQWMPMFTEGLA